MRTKILVPVALFLHDKSSTFALSPGTSGPLIEGHGRQAFVERTDGTNTLANKAEGLVDLRGGRR
jgi:hypothetical protein